MNKNSKAAAKKESSAKRSRQVKELRQDKESKRAEKATAQKNENVRDKEMLDRGNDKAWRNKA